MKTITHYSINVAGVEVVIKPEVYTQILKSLLFKHENVEYKQIDENVKRIGYTDAVTKQKGIFTIKEHTKEENKK